MTNFELGLVDNFRRECVENSPAHHVVFGFLLDLRTWCFLVPPKRGSAKSLHNQISMVQPPHGGFRFVIGVPPNIPSSHPFLDGIFHHKPSILGTPMTSWKALSIYRLFGVFLAVGRDPSPGGL